MMSVSKRIGAGFLALLIIFCLLPQRGMAAEEIKTTPTGYTSAADVNYQTVQQGGKTITVNWGARGEACVFLSTPATNFYTGNYTFDTLSKVTGGSSQSNAPQSELYSSLKSLMVSKHSYQTSYAATKELYRYTDCLLGDYSKISSFYSGTVLNGNWDSGATWNREHTWPNSKGLAGNDENDIMMLRPTAKSENYSRGNTAYGQSSGYYNPGVSNHGDVARIVLYVYVRWGNTSFMWGRGGVMENLDVLLQWMEEDPVDTWEMGRNDAVQSITGTRNVFVDYPEYAWLLFGKDVPEGITTPSGNDGVTANPGGSNNSGSSSDNTADSSYTQISSLKDGDKIVIVNPASGMALSTTKTGFYNIGVDVSGGFGSISDAEIFTAKKNSDGSWSFASGDGKKLALAAEYSSLNDTGINDKWTLSSAGDNQFYLLNTGRDLYLEWYASKYNWSAYNPGSLNEDYALAFYVKTSTGSSNNSSGSTTATTPPTTQPPETQPPVDTTTPPASEPTATEGTQATAPAAKPSQPAPLPTASVNPDDFIPKEEDPAPSVGAVLAIIAVLLVAGIAVIIVIKKKHDN